VTLVVTVNGPESIWLLADRRLSFVGRAPRDDARKIMFLETTDGVAILAYAGLGVTALGTEPSDWMSAVLRTRNLPLEQSLGVLADAMRKTQFPQHLRNLLGRGAPVHTVVVPAFLGEEPRLYTIDLAFTPDRKSYHFRYTRHVVDKPPAPRRTQRLAIAGSGAAYLTRDKTWTRSLLGVVRASDRGQVPPLVVADHLANLNKEVHRKDAEVHGNDASVGPRCIVAWRHRKGGIHGGGGSHQFYTDTTRDVGSLTGTIQVASLILPTIANGMDVGAIGSLLIPHMIERAQEMEAGQPAKEFNCDEFSAAVARLPDKPDENLR
jgi:hypothetical protein